MTIETLVEELRDTVANCRNPKPKHLAPEFWPTLADEIEKAADALTAKDTALSEMRVELTEALENVERYVAVAREENDRAHAAEAELAALREALDDIKLDITLADGISRGFDLKPTLAKLARALTKGQGNG